MKIPARRSKGGNPMAPFTLRSLRFLLFKNRAAEANRMPLSFSAVHRECSR
jgi:hypothetical protein